MRIRTLGLLSATLALTFAAPAAGWVERATYDVPGGEVADCLRTAAPGQVALLGALGRRTMATDLLSVGVGGFARSPGATFGDIGRCAAVATADGVPPLFVAATRVWDGRRWTGPILQVAGGGGQPERLEQEGSNTAVGSVVASLAADGAAVVAWDELRFAPRHAFPVDLVRAALRPAAGAPFGPVVTLGHGSLVAMATPAVGIDASGRATVAWFGGTDQRPSISIASALAGGAFEPPQLLRSTFDETLSMSVAPNGRALLVAGGLALEAFERPAGPARFAHLLLPDSGTAENVAAAVQDDGGALVAYDDGLDSVHALLRPPGERFHRVKMVTRGREPDSSSSFVFFVKGGTGQTPPSDDTRAALTAALGPGGNVLLTWVDPAHGRHAATARVAHGTLTHGFSTAARLGSPCRPVAAVRPVTLAGGGFGVAWTDNAATLSLGDFDQPLDGGRLHLDVPGAYALPARATSPGLLAKAVATKGHTGPLAHVRVRCTRGPCDVRALATVFDRLLHEPPTPTTLSATTTLAAGRGGLLELGLPGPRLGREQPPRTVTLTACSPRGPIVQRLTVAVEPPR